MRLNQIRDFVSIVEAGSIRAAARAHGVSHPAMTKSLRLLEAEVGAALVRRGSHGVDCTPAGRAFLARARTIQAEVRKAKEEVAELAPSRGGAVSAGFSPTAAMTVGPEATARYLEQHPQTRLRVMEGSTSVLLPLVRDETLDFAVVQRIPGATGPGLRFRPLYRDHMAIVCRRGHPMRGAKALRDFADAHWLGFHGAGSGGWLEDAFAAAGLAFPRRFILCESFAFAFELLSQTDAVMAMTMSVLTGPLNRGRLVEIALEDRLPGVVVGMCTRSGTRLTPLAATLARAVAERTRALARAR